MARERGYAGTSADMPFRQALARIMRRRAEEMWSHAPGTIAGEDIEELHQMRVASRRLRAAVDIGSACFPGKAFARYRRVVRGITDALGGVRDADVMLALLQAERERATPEERAGIDDLIAVVAARRAALRPAMIAYLSDLQARGFHQELDRLLDGE